MSSASGSLDADDKAQSPRRNAELTLVILARDAASILPECLKQVVGWHPVLVAVDARTTDESASIAAEFGTEVHELQWQGGFAEQRNAAASLASTDWILFVDADESVNDGLKSEVDSLIATGPVLSSYSVPRKNIHFGQRLRHGGWWPDRQTRLISRLETNFSGMVHERADVPQAAIGELRHALTHRTHNSVAEVLQKIETYSELEALGSTAHRESRPSQVSVALSPIWHLLWRYFFLLGFLDGQVGFVEARLQSYYRHLVLLRRRVGENAQPSAFFRRLIPKDPQPFSSSVAERIPPFPRDVLSLGFMLLLVWLPFHLVLKRVLPEPLGETWKEGLVLVLLVAACFRLYPSAWVIVRNSWLFRLATGYVVLVTLCGLLTGKVGAALDGMHVDLTYIALVAVILAMPSAERFPAMLWSTISAGIVCAAGAIAETLLGYPLFPSATLLQQYGNASVYINATHILRPYFTFDFPTGLAAYLAVGTVLCVALWLTSRQYWFIPVAALLSVGMALTFSRGPWIGALFGLAVLTLLLRRSPLALRVGAVVGAVAVLIASGLLTSGSRSAAPTMRRLYTSSRVRGLVGKPMHEGTITTMLGRGQLVERAGLPPPAATVSATRWNFGAMKLPVLGEPPPKRGRALLAYRVHVRPKEVFSWGIALDPRVWHRNRGDGVTFRVSIEANRNSIPVFARYIDPKNKRQDRRPYFLRFPLFRYSGQTILIRLTTDQGPRADSSYDWAGWLNPRIVSVTGSGALDRWPYVGVAPVTIERPLPAPGPYLSSFVDWHGDESNSDRLAAWHRAWTAWLQAPLLGHGPGSVDEAAIQAGVHHPLVTESQFGKVLVETGIIGFLVWLAICGLGLWYTFAAYRRKAELETIAVLASLACITVCSLAFQVLEVKQIAALFWSLTACAVVAELALQGIEVEIPCQDITRLFPADAKERIAGLLQGWRFPTPAFPVAAPVPAYAVATGLEASGMHAIAESKADYLPMSYSPEPSAERTSPHLGVITEVLTTDDDAVVNERLNSGWELIDVRLANGKPGFILGRRTT